MDKYKTNFALLLGYDYKPKFLLFVVNYTSIEEMEKG